MPVAENVVTQQKNFSLKIWKKIWPFIRPYRAYLFGAIAMMMVTASIDICYPLFQKYAVDSFIRPMQSQGIVPFALLYLGALLLQTFLVVMFSRYSMVVEMNIGRGLKRAAFVHLQKLSFSYYNTTPVGYIMARVMSDTGRIGGVVAWGITDIFWALVYVIGVFISMLFLNWRLALLVITVVPFIALLTVYFQNKILRVNREIRKVNSQMTGAFNE
ncbi:MAG: ABC transporter transmembrane domain-containing protein, partial [Oscillospiraceae bacterium]